VEGTVREVKRGGGGCDLPSVIRSMTLGSSQLNKLWHSLVISILDDLKSFIN